MELALGIIAKIYCAFDLMEDQTLTDCIDNSCQTQPNKWAYIFHANTKDAPHRISYQQLQQQSQQLAQQIIPLTNPGDRVILLYPSSLDFIVAFYACWYAGTIAVPCQTPLNASSADKLQAIIDNCQPTLILSNQATCQQLVKSQQTKWGKAHDFIQKLCQDLTFDDTTTQYQLAQQYWLNTDLISADPINAPLRTLNAQDIALLQYTSGSTGQAKGVMLSQQNLIANIKLLESLYQKQYQSRYVVSWLPLTHDMGLIGAMLHTTFGGGCLAFMSPQQFARRPWFWLELMSRYRSEGTGAPPLGYDLTAERLKPEHLQNIDLSNWQYAMCGAEPIHPQPLIAFQQKLAPLGFKKDVFCPSYGLAEATLLVSFNRGLTLGQKHHTNHLVNCGQPLQMVKIVDPETHQIVEEGQTGEIWITGPCVGQGYWNQPQLTKQTFHAQISGDMNHTHYLRTGDLGLLEQGQLFVMGRLKETIIIHGQNFYPAEIEPVIQSAHPALHQQSCVALCLPEKAQPLVLICELNKRTSPTDYRHIIQSIETALYQYCQIQADQIGLLPTSSIPRTTSGKPQRLACKQAMLDQSILNKFPDLVWSSTLAPGTTQ